MEDVIVKVTQTVRPGNVFVPFHFNTQLVNTLTQPEFDPISGEPNYKQTAIQLHSQKVPAGIRMKEEVSAGSLAYDSCDTARTYRNEKVKTGDNA